MMKKLILLLSLHWFFIYVCMAQYVTLQGNQFMLNGKKFYPMVVNFSVAKIYKNGIFSLSPDHCYGYKFGHTCYDIPSCNEEMQTHFNYIAGMGFNTVRVLAIAPLYDTLKKKLVIKVHSDNNKLDSIPINLSNPSDPGMLALFSYYDQLLEAANATSLKIIFLPMGKPYFQDAYSLNLWTDFLSVIASYFSTANHNDALLAYDLMNEPGTYPNLPTKQVACEIISTWYDVIKANDPHHLVTIGNHYGIYDIFSFDPSMLKVDFNSVHFYVQFRPYEDRTQPAIQELARKRTANILYWMQQNSIVPWIIGETGYTASASWGINYGLHGTLANQADYAQYTLDALCNCGGIGYSWFDYQDLSYVDISHPKYYGNFYGLREREYSPIPPVIDKPAVDIFRNYVRQVTEPCPVDRTPTYNANKLYYNFWGYPRNPAKEISGYVKDQHGNPIKDAVIGVNVNMGDVIPPVPHPNNPDKLLKRLDDSFTTFTDETGYFNIIPYQFDPFGTIGIPNDFPGIYRINISAAGASTFLLVKYPILQQQIPNPIVLNRINYDVVVSGETVYNGQTKTYSGRKSLTVSNTNINSGGNAVFTSSKTINLLPGFNAAAGSIVKMYIAPFNCEDISFISKTPHTSIVFEENNDTNFSAMKELQLVFEKEFSENYLSVFPNPANHTVTVQLHSHNPEASFKHITLYDILGRVILSSSTEINPYVFDVSIYPKGIYFIKATDETTNYYQKIIIQ